MFYLKHGVSDIESCPSFHDKPTQFGPIDEDIP
jgi:hypothetical protein